MRRFKTVSHLMGWGLLLLWLVVLMLWGISRTMGPTDEELAARDLLTIAEPASGINGLDLFNEMLDASDHEGAEVIAAEDAQHFCSASRPDCVARVRSEPDRYRDLIDRYSALIEQAERLATADHLTMGFVPGEMLSLKELRLAELPATAQAARFVAGDIDGAMDAACKQATAWIRLSERSNQRAAGFMAGYFATGLYGRLVTEFLAELPPGHPLPDRCDALGQPPVQASQKLCNIVRGEYRMLAATLEDLENTQREVAAAERSWPFGTITGFRADAILDMAAPYYSQWCEPDMLAAIEADDPSPPRRDPPSMWQLRCLSNHTGCLVMDVMTSDFGAPHVFKLQQRARRHALAVVLWLHRHPQAMAGESLDLPDELIHPRHQLMTEDGKPYLAVRRHSDDCEDRPWRLPLPGSAKGQAVPSEKSNGSAFTAGNHQISGCSGQ